MKDNVISEGECRESWFFALCCGCVALVSSVMMTLLYSNEDLFANALIVSVGATSTAVWLGHRWECSLVGSREPIRYLDAVSTSVGIGCATVLIVTLFWVPLVWFPQAWSQVGFLEGVISSLRTVSVAGFTLLLACPIWLPATLLLGTFIYGWSGRSLGSARDSKGRTLALWSSLALSLFCSIFFTAAHFHPLKTKLLEWQLLRGDVQLFYSHTCKPSLIDAIFSREHHVEGAANCLAEMGSQASSALPSLDYYIEHGEEFYNSGDGIYFLKNTVRRAASEIRSELLGLDPKAESLCEP